MIFNFGLLGLIILTGIIINEYTKKRVKKEENTVYRTFILFTYITEVLYTASYIAIKQNIGSIIFIKSYLIFLSISFSILSLYYIMIGLKNKYQSKQTTYENKLKLAKKLFICINIITIILLSISKITINDNKVMGQGIYINYLLISIYTIINIISLASYYKTLNTKQNNNLVLIIIISLICNIISYNFIKIPAINSGIVLISLLLFLNLENTSNEHLEILQLERDHARENNLDKNKFLKYLSHEIRTPLNTIDGFCQVIEDSDDIKSIKEDTKDIRRASRSLIDKINAIIDMNIIESGNLEIINESYNTTDLIENIENITKSMLKDSKVKFTTTIDEDLPKTLEGDSERIEQVILSIINNSIKYTKEGTIKLDINSINSKAMCRLKITISDTGTGIKESELNNIFNNDKNNNLDYSSLNLKYSKKLLELMNGKIDVESIEGKGSTFTITIDQKNSDLKEVKKVDKKNIKYFDASDKRILLVDDNKLNIKVASKLLEPYKVEITEAISGKECLDILENDTNFDLILMDDLMPEMSGTETLDILQKIERVEGYRIPVVVLTANAINGMKTKYLDAGFDDYLAKPIDKYELNRVLKKYLKNSKED